MGLIGYARISTIEGAQVLDRQLDALNVAGCERIFEDRASGAKAERPGLSACLDFLRKDDVLVVLDLDRLGRLAGELITLIDQLATRGVAFRALNAPMDTTTPAGRAFLQIQAAFAEMERNIIRQRVNEGLVAARARGRKVTGRRMSLTTFSPWLCLVPGFCLISTPWWLRCARNPILSNHPKLSHWR